MTAILFRMAVFRLDPSMSLYFPERRGKFDWCFVLAWAGVVIVPWAAIIALISWLL
jgi:hypothetical protein